MPSLNIVTKSILLAAVLKVAYPLVNLTPVNVAVLPPVASCLILIATLCPASKLESVNVVLCASVTVKTLPNEQSTVIEEEDVNAVTISIDPVPVMVNVCPDTAVLMPVPPAIFNVLPNPMSITVESSEAMPIEASRMFKKFESNSLLVNAAFLGMESVLTVLVLIPLVTNFGL